MAGSRGAVSSLGRQRQLDARRDPGPRPRVPVDPHTLPCVVARGSGWGSLQKHTLTSLPCMPRLWQGTCLPQRTEVYSF